MRRRVQLLVLPAILACGRPEAGSSATETGASSTGADPTTEVPTTGSPTSDGSTTGDATTGDAASTTSTSADPNAVPGCDTGSFLPVPEDTSVRGPWPVGARTVDVAGLTVEVWYPAIVGSDAGQEKIRYDIREGLPDSEQGKVSDDDNPWQPCDCYRDLPLDELHGPYPAVVFVHGTAGFRSQSLEHVLHWASRGFVVVAADHPGLWLKDLLGSLCGAPMVQQNLGADISALVAALKAPVGGLGFLAGHVDGGRLAMAGHSAGGNAISGGGDAARVLIPMAAGGVQDGGVLESALILGAQADKVVNYSNQQDGFDAAPAPKRLVGIANAGHLTFSSLCEIRNAMGQDFLEIAEANMVCGAQFAGFLFDCDPTYTPAETGWTIVNDVTAAVLESVLRCSDVAKNFADLGSRYPEVGEYKEAL